MRLVFLSALLLSGCGFFIAPPAPSIDKPVLTPSDELGRILSKIDAQGRFDYEVMGGHPSNVDAFAAYLATFSPASDPERFPTAVSKLAYWINAYNVLVLYEVLDTDERPADQKRFYRRAKFMVGGKLMTLSDVEERVADMKDARAFFALCGGAKGHPKLSPSPYEPGTLEAQLDAAAREFLSDPKNVVVDKAKRVVRLSEVLERHKGVFEERAVSLLAYVNRFRTDKVPETYKVEFLPFDWSLNSQKEERQADSGAPAGRRL
ncbi:MAG: DUF547 domain-containing protein [Elusimicrobia bacterium]|nr:DUF547 domain-containing protein [Elusimicrobiota bacterium]